MHVQQFFILEIFTFYIANIQWNEEKSRYGVEM